MTEPTQANGYRHGRPAHRDLHPLDTVVERTINALPAETRLYPDVYAWQVTDAILSALTRSPHTGGVQDLISELRSVALSDALAPYLVEDDRLVILRAAELLEEHERNNPSACTCGYGGYHEPENKNCEANQ